MSALALALPHPAPYTVYDLLQMPDDGNRYEVWEGSLIVSPAPSRRHQRVADRLCRLLDDAAPDGVEAVTAVAVRLGEDGTGPVPDVVVAQAGDEVAETVVDAAEALAVVEVVSPSTRTQDRIGKPARYAAAGIPCYWRVELDPFRDQGDDELPVVLVYALDDGHYKCVTRLAAGTVGQADLPYPVRFDTADLLRRR